ADVALLPDHRADVDDPRARWVGWVIWPGAADDHAPAGPGCLVDRVDLEGNRRPFRGGVELGSRSVWNTTRSGTLLVTAGASGGADPGRTWAFCCDGASMKGGRVGRRRWLGTYGWT